MTGLTWSRNDCGPLLGVHDTAPPAESHLMNCSAPLVEGRSPQLLRVLLSQRPVRRVYAPAVFAIGQRSPRLRGLSHGALQGHNREDYIGPAQCLHLGA